MAKKKLGKKYVCYQCECKFYDLSQPQPICPKCGANQNEAPTKSKRGPARARVTAAAPPRSRAGRRRNEEGSLEPTSSFSEDEDDSPLEDKLTMIDDEELLDSGEDDFSEED
jgi:hypothetical protein